MNPGKKVDAPPMVDNLRYGPSYQRKSRRLISTSPPKGASLAPSRCVTARLSVGSSRPGPCVPRSWPLATRRTRRAAEPMPCATRSSAEPSAEQRLASPEVYDVLDLCLSCKACKTECPSSVDMAKIKTEFLAHYHERHGTPLRSRVFGHIHDLSRLASRRSRRQSGDGPGAGQARQAAPGSGPGAPALPFAFRTFSDRWHAHQRRLEGKARETRGQVVYFHDTFTEYNYPRIGVGAVKLLEAAGFDVIVEERRVCCGRPMLSKGLVDDARKLAERNVAVLAPYAHMGFRSSAPSRAAF